MRILVWGTYDRGKPRIRILCNGMRAAGAQVDEIHANIWVGVEDKSQVRGLGARLHLLARWIFAYPRLIWRLAKAPKPDLLLISYPGILDAFIASFFGRWRHIPVAWDVFISIYDTIVEDRKMHQKGSLAARLLHGLERRALQRVDLVFMDTQAHARRLESLFALPENSCGSVWVGAETEHFLQRDSPPARASDAPMKVLFYGQFIPLHGIPTIVEAARILKDAPIEWTLIGRGQESERVRAMLDREPLPKLHWFQWVAYKELEQWMAKSDICLGIFGDSAKAASVIPNKVFQIVAAGRPLITRDSPAIRELLSHTPGCIYLIPNRDAAALANAVLEHFSSSDWKLGISCHRKALNNIDHKAIGSQFLDLMQQRLIAGRAQQHD